MIIALVMLLRSLWGFLTGFLALGIGGIAFLAGGFDPGAVTIIWGIATLIIALVGLVLAWGLFSIKPWAWMWTVIILVISMGFDFFAGEGPLMWIGIIVSLVILIYLVSVRSTYLEQ
jgi:hypothetical protein